jgi:hypothetical protein
VGLHTAEVEVEKIAMPQGEATYILCCRGKERAMRSRFSFRMERVLQGPERTIATGV